MTSSGPVITRRSADPELTNPELANLELTNSERAGPYGLAIWFKSI